MAPEAEAVLLFRLAKMSSQSVGPFRLRFRSGLTVLTSCVCRVRLSPRVCAHGLSWLATPTQLMLGRACRSIVGIGIGWNLAIIRHVSVAV